MTRAAIPVLVSQGVTALTSGVNGFSAPPGVPKVGQAATLATLGQHGDACCTAPAVDVPADDCRCWLGQTVGVMPCATAWEWGLSLLHLALKLLLIRAVCAARCVALTPSTSHGTCLQCAPQPCRPPHSSGWMSRRAHSCSTWCIQVKFLATQAYRHPHAAVLLPACSTVARGAATTSFAGWLLSGC